MITLKTLTWDNCLSYGQNNSIDLNSEPLIQVIGDNGSGKTSIPLILQEVLYGKNVKNIKKQDFANRHTTIKGYSIALDFTKGEDEYRIVLNRKTNIKLDLYKNDEKISSHTSAATYKTISDIIGISDFKTFTQLIYQSSTSSLEFLTATDTNRKKFLIGLLQLEKYIDLHDTFKEEVKESTNDFNILEAKISVLNSWVKQNENMDLTLQELQSTEKYDLTDKIEELGIKKDKLTNIKSINQKINNNNTYKEMLNNLHSYDPSITYNETMHKLVIDAITELNLEVRQDKTLYDKLMGLDDVCPTCTQEISSNFKEGMIEDVQVRLNSADTDLKDKISTKDSYATDKVVYTKNTFNRNELERLLLLIDQNLASKTIDKVELEHEILDLQEYLEEKEAKLKNIQNHNLRVAAHNSEVKVVKKQLKEYKDDLTNRKRRRDIIKDELDILEIIKKIFSTNGLVSYKIESSVKELERTINEYLAELCYFQIFFKLEKDKLNIQVVDDTGEDTNIENLSAGELGRVNIATVLAIRKILASLTSTKINFLFLDEIVGVLDTSGKEKLTELLLEENLNTFMVAHEFEHPLVSKLNIVKKNNISRIEYG